MNIVFTILGIQKAIKTLNKQIPRLGWQKANALFLSSIGVKIEDNGADFPKKGGTLVFANHPTGLDFNILSSVIPRNDVYILSDYYQTKKGEAIASHLIPMYDTWDGMFKRPVLQWPGFFWMRTTTPGATTEVIKKRNKQALEEVLAYLKQGHVVIVFPSGGDSEERPWKPGIGQLLLDGEKAHVAFSLFSFTLKNLSAKGIFLHFLLGRQFFKKNPISIVGKQVQIPKHPQATNAFHLSQTLKQNVSLS